MSKPKVVLAKNQVILTFYTPKELTPPSDRTLILVLSGATVIGVFDNDVYYTDMGWELTEGSVANKMGTSVTARLAYNEGEEK